MKLILSDITCDSVLTAGPTLPSWPGLPGLPVTPYRERAWVDNMWDSVSIKTNNNIFESFAEGPCFINIWTLHMTESDVEPTLDPGAPGAPGVPASPVAPWAPIGPGAPRSPGPPCHTREAESGGTSRSCESGWLSLWLKLCHITWKVWLLKKIK